MTRTPAVPKRAAPTAKAFDVFNAALFAGCATAFVGTVVTVTTGGGSTGVFVGGVITTAGGGELVTMLAT